MRAIIAGGRDYNLTTNDYELLNELKDELPITTVVCGMARGADMDGHFWANLNNLPIDEYHAEWDEHGRSAGPIRNSEMACAADALIAFPGGKGTENMILNANIMGLRVIRAGYRRTSDGAA